MRLRPLRELPRVDDHHFGFGERHCQEAIQVLRRNAIELHIAIGVEQAEEAVLSESRLVCRKSNGDGFHPGRQCYDSAMAREERASLAGRSF